MLFVAVCCLLFVNVLFAVRSLCLLFEVFIVCGLVLLVVCRGSLFVVRCSSRAVK